jgi:NADP-dependent 3-hydroxy acid dehydrogenase YdfG
VQKLDVTDPAVLAAETRFVRIDVLVNNSGTSLGNYSDSPPLVDCSMESAAVFLLTQYILAA